MPELVRRKYLGDFFVYTEQEAKDYKLDYKYWAEVTKEGDWALSDDGYVAEVRSIKHYPKKTSKRTGHEIKLCYGTFWYETEPDGTLKNKAKCNFIDRLEKRAFSYSAAITFGEKMLRVAKMRRMIRTATKMLINQGSINYERLGALFMENQALPVLSVKRVLKQKKVIEYMEEQVSKQFAQWGLDDETIVKRCFVGALELAEKNKDADVMLKVGIELAKLKNMYPQKKQVVNHYEASRNTEYLEGIVNKEEQKLILSKQETITE
jgi:hypothetical protein